MYPTAITPNTPTMSLWYLYILLLCGNIAVGIIRRKHLGPALKVMLGIIITVLVTEVTKRQLKAPYIALVDHLYFIGELLLLLVYYHVLLARNKRKLLYAGLVFFLTAVFVLSLATPGYLWQNNYIDFVFLAVCVSVWSGCFFYELLQKPIQHSLKSDGNFWINCSNFLYYPGTVLLFGYSAYIEHVNPAFSHSLNIMSNMMNLVLYLLYLVAFAIARKQY